MPGHALFQWMLRHAAWSHNRFQHQSHRGGTPWEIRTGTCYKSPWLPFMEACMIRVPVGLPGLRRKLDVQWMKGIWVGRLDEIDGHVVLTLHGTVTGRSVRRLAGHLRIQPDLVGKIKSRVQDPALSQAELLRVLPASVPIRLSGETDTDQLAEEQDRAAQNEQMEGIVDERVRAEITRPLRSIQDDNDVEVKRQRLGEPLATIPETSDEMMEDPVPIVHEDWKRERLTKKTSREHEEMSSSSSGPKRMRMSCLRVSNVIAVQKPSTRTEESIAKSRAEHIKHLLETGAVKDWDREDAIKTGAKILSGKMVDDAHKEKSRYCAREFATFKDPSVFAAASDVDNTSLIVLLAVKRGHGIMCFDAVAAFGQAPETELIFIEAPEEHRAVVGQHVLWQCLKVREGRRKGARAWQDHFVETLLSQDCPGPDNFLLK